MYVARSSTCPNGQFQCVNGHCLPMKSRCNGTIECPDHSDEKGCGYRYRRGSFTFIELTHVTRQKRQVSNLKIQQSIFKQNTFISEQSTPPSCCPLKKHFPFCGVRASSSTMSTYRMCLLLLRCKANKPLTWRKFCLKKKMDQPKTHSTDRWELLCARQQSPMSKEILQFFSKLAPFLSCPLRVVQPSLP